MNLTRRPAPSCSDTTTGTTFTSALSERAVPDRRLTSSRPTRRARRTRTPRSRRRTASRTAPEPPGGCTRDIVHEFYQEQYQLNGGGQNRYVTGSDAVGLSWVTTTRRRCPIYTYLHASGHPHYVIADNFFQAAFGGSFLNHQWLIAAATPTYPDAPANLHSIIDSNGMPVDVPAVQADRHGPARAAHRRLPVAGRRTARAATTRSTRCSPRSQPFGAFGAKLPLQTAPTIGDRLSAKGRRLGVVRRRLVERGGRGQRARAGRTAPGPNCSDPNVIPKSPYPYCPDAPVPVPPPAVQLLRELRAGHAGPRAPAGRGAFLQTLQGSSKTCGLKSVSFVKPIGEENEHPGYASDAER